MFLVKYLCPGLVFALNCGSYTASLETWIWPSALCLFMRFLFSWGKPSWGARGLTDGKGICTPGPTPPHVGPRRPGPRLARDLVVPAGQGGDG